MWSIDELLASPFGKADYFYTSHVQLYYEGSWHNVESTPDQARIFGSSWQGQARCGVRKMGAQLNPCHVATIGMNLPHQ